jgi:predicted porin
MKKSLLALAVLGAFAGAASAQSSVTLFGIVDVNARQVKTGNQTVQSLGTDGINSSRLGFRGVEDLGGGLKAGFWIEGALSPDDGTAGGQTWRRRSTVSLMGGFGEVRLGRDYTPTFWNLTVFDPFGTNGVGSFLNVFQSGGVTTPLGSGAQTLVRANNTIGYFLPSGIGGIYGQAQVAAGEGTPGNKYAGGRIGYAAGPVDVAVAYGQTQTAGDGKFKMFDVGGAYTFGIAKLTAQYARMKTDTLAMGAGVVGGVDAQADVWQIGTVVTLGQGEIHAAYDQAKGKNDYDGLKARQIAVGYVYNLSKRTALYGTFSDLKNEGGSSFVVATPPNVTANSLNAAGTVLTLSNATDQKSRGFEFGIRHSF